MRGASLLEIMTLAGHTDMKTTMRYMHLARGSKEDAIALLKGPAVPGRGAGVEQAKAEGSI